MDLSKIVNEEEDRIRKMSKQYVIASFKGNKKLNEIRSRLTALFLGYSWNREQITDYFTDLIRVRNQKDLEEVFEQYNIGQKND